MSTPQETRTREIKPGFVAERQRQLQASRDLTDFAAVDKGKVSEAELCRVCLKDPARFEQLVSRGLRVTAYPQLGKTLMEGGNSGKDLDRSLTAFKQAGGRIGWQEMRHGARHLKTKNFLVLMQHGPRRETTPAADLFAGILADHPHHAKEVLQSKNLGSKGSRIIAAFASLRPERGAEIARPTAPSNPLIPPKQDFDRFFGR